MCRLAENQTNKIGVPSVVEQVISWKPFKYTNNKRRRSDFAYLTKLTNKVLDRYETCSYNDPSPHFMFTNEENVLKKTKFNSPISTINVSMKNDVFLPIRGPDGNGVISVADGCARECDRSNAVCRGTAMKPFEVGSSSGMSCPKLSCPLLWKENWKRNRSNGCHEKFEKFVYDCVKTFCIYECYCALTQRLMRKYASQQLQVHIFAEWQPSILIMNSDERSAPHR